MSRPTSRRARRPLSLIVALSALIASALAGCGRAPTEVPPTSPRPAAPAASAKVAVPTLPGAAVRSI